MKIITKWVQWLLVASISLTGYNTAYSAEQATPLVTVGDYTITDYDIERVIVSSPLADQYPTLNEKDQAAMRGAILMRLVNLQLLYLEALDRGMEQDPTFIADREDFIKGITYKLYMDRLRASIKIPDTVMSELLSRLKGNSGALDASIAQYKAQQYKLVRSLALKKIRDQVHLAVHEDRITPAITPKTILAEADNYIVSFSDLGIKFEDKDDFHAATIEERLYQRLEVDLINMVSKEISNGLKNRIEAFSRERLPAMLLMQKENEWAPDRAAARAYFEQHRELGFIPEQRMISQIVLDSREKAEAIKKRILAGESFFRMAKLHSIDPYGRKNAGQMGWLTKGKAMPAIEQVLENMQEEDISEIAETGKGFHLILLQGIKPSVQHEYEEVYDRVRQAITDEYLPPFVRSLQHKYKIEFADPVAEIPLENP